VSRPDGTLSLQRAFARMLGASSTVPSMGAVYDEPGPSFSSPFGNTAGWNIAAALPAGRTRHHVTKPSSADSTRLVQLWVPDRRHPTVEGELALAERAAFPRGIRRPPMRC
jgi:hypothetical protein